MTVKLVDDTGRRSCNENNTFYNSKYSCMFVSAMLKTNATTVMILYQLLFLLFFSPFFFFFFCGMDCCNEQYCHYTCTSQICIIPFPVTLRTNGPSVKGVLFAQRMNESYGKFAKWEISDSYTTLTITFAVSVVFSPTPISKNVYV